MSMPLLQPPLVSIVVVTYRHSDYIDETLASCVQQADDYPNIEIVVADDGSPDDTQDRVRAWQARYPELIKPVLAAENRGLAANFTAAKNAATGKYVAWLGGDDVMLAGKIAAQVPVLESHPEASACYHDAEVFEWPSGNVLGAFSALYGGKAFSVEAVDAVKMLDPRYQMLPSTLLVRRAAMPEAFDARLRFHNDYLFDFETIAKGGPYVRMSGSYVRYRKHAGSIGRSPATQALMLEENLMVMAIVIARYPRLAGAVRRREIYYLTVEALKARQRGDVARAADLRRLVAAKGAPLRAAALALLGAPLAKLADPDNRALALKLRSLFG
ncbi:MAG: hypothetical protein C0474_00080 [Sphingobium sp.]|nr:hypothetical protein [Sphingobium sp.]